MVAVRVGRLVCKRYEGWCVEHCAVCHDTRGMLDCDGWDSTISGLVFNILAVLIEDFDLG